MSYVPTVAFLDGGGHGDIVYKTFCSSVTVPHHPVSINVMNDAGTGNHKEFVAALESCAAQKIDIINLSIGTQQYTDFAAIAAAVKNLPDTIIIAACSNQNRLTFPACMPQVIGVRGDTTNELESGFAYLNAPYDNIEIIMARVAANSLAAPRITAKVCEYFAQGCKGEREVRERLRGDAKPFAPDYEYYKNIIRPWESIEVPVVTMPEGIAVPVDLLQDFIADGYRPIFLSKTAETDCESIVFQLKWQGRGEAGINQLVELYYNFARPDIIFLHGVSPDEYKPDLILTEKDMNITLKQLEERLA